MRAAIPWSARQRDLFNVWRALAGQPQDPSLPAGNALMGAQAGQGACGGIPQGSRPVCAPGTPLEFGTPQPGRDAGRFFQGRSSRLAGMQGECGP